MLGLTNDAPRGVLMMELCEPGDLKTQDFGPPVPDQRSECKSPGPCSKVRVQVPRSSFKAHLVELAGKVKSPGPQCARSKVKSPGP